MLSHPIFLILHQVSLRLLTGFDQFVLDPLSGDLRVAPNSTLLDFGSRVFEHTYLIEIEAFDSHLPVPHVARTNVTVFARPLPSTLRNEEAVLIVDPVDGLDVELPEHYRGQTPLRLGQFSVRNAPVGSSHRLVCNRSGFPVFRIRLYSCSLEWFYFPGVSGPHACSSDTYTQAFTLLSLSHTYRHSLLLPVRINLFYPSSF